MRGSDVRQGELHPAGAAGPSGPPLRPIRALLDQAQATQVVGASEPAVALDLATAIPGDHRVTLGGGFTPRMFRPADLPIRPRLTVVPCASTSRLPF